MTIEQAIKKALEGGYEPEYYSGLSNAEHFMKPLFWQSLGKAMGWESQTWNFADEGGKELDGGSWLSYWHRFIDHLADGKTAETFFETLQ